MTAAGTSGRLETIQDNNQEFVSIFEAIGLDLGGLVGLIDPQILAIDVPSYVDPDCLAGDYAEYVGIIGTWSSRDSDGCREYSVAQ